MTVLRPHYSDTYDFVSHPHDCISILGVRFANSTYRNPFSFSLLGWISAGAHCLPSNTSPMSQANLPHLIGQICLTSFSIYPNDMLLFPCESGRQERLTNIRKVFITYHLRRFLSEGSARGMVYKQGFYIPGHR
jgi:hypothetical protein